MGYWLKSFNKKPHPVPGVTFTVPQINNRKSCSLKAMGCSWLIIVPLTTTGIFIVIAFLWGWLSDGPCRGARWPFIYAGAVITVSTKTPHSILFSPKPLANQYCYSCSLAFSCARCHCTRISTAVKSSIGLVTLGWVPYHIEKCVSESTGTPCSSSLLGRSRSSHFKLDQRDLLGRHREESVACSNG